MCRFEDATAAQLRAAQKTFEAADELYDGEQFESAIATFRTSYGIVASPNTRLMIARAMQKLGDVRGAYAELESAVSLAEKAATKRKKYEPTLKAVREELAVLRGRVGFLDLRVVEPTTIASLTVEDRPVDVAAITPGDRDAGHRDGGGARQRLRGPPLDGRRRRRRGRRCRARAHGPAEHGAVACSPGRAP